MVNQSRSSASSIARLQAYDGFFVKQRTEGFELFGFEGANSYDILAPDGQRVFHAAERQGGFWDGFSRQLAGHTLRAFEVDVVDESGRPVLHISHPPRWILQRIEVRSGSGRLLGTLEQCFTWIDKKLVVRDAAGQPRFSMVSSLLTPWDFGFTRTPPRSGRRVAEIRKVWGGITRELFTDADAFSLSYESRSLEPEERALLLAATLFIDLVWFEVNAGS